MSGGRLTPQFVGGLGQGLAAVGQSAQNQLMSQQIAKGEQQAAISPQVNALRTQALTDPNALSQLAALSPSSAQEILQFQQGQQQLAQQQFTGLQDREQARVRSVVTGALELSGAGSREGKIKVLERRQKENARSGVDSVETNEVLELFRAGRDEEANELINQTVSLGERLGLVKGGAAPKILEGVGPEGEAGFFAVTPGGASRIPGASPGEKAPLVTIAGEETESKELAKLRVKRLGELQERARDARQQIASLDILDSLDVRTGRSEPFKLAIASFAESFGIDASALADVPAGQIFTAESGKLLLRVLTTQKGPQTDADRDFIKTTLAGFGNAPEANEFIKRAARAKFELTLDEERFKERAIEQGQSLNASQVEWKKVADKIPFVSLHVKDNDGLPIFYFQFKEAVAEANPGASDAEIQDAWNNQEAEARAAGR